MNEFLDVVVEIWNYGLLGISVSKIVISLLVLLFAFIFRGFFTNIFVGFLQNLASKSESTIDDDILATLKKPLGYVPLTIGLYVVTLILALDGQAGEIASNVVRAAIVLTIFSALANAVAPIFAALSSTAWLTESMQTWLQRASKAIIWIIGIAIALEIFGIQIGPLVAGLGLFSVAVALGAQDLFKNLISGILIIGENRFQPGDRIEVPGALHGIVETIGFRSTVIRTFDTAPMIIPNKDLSDVKLINHGEMQYRRINWTINLLYSTSNNDLEKICVDIKNHISESKDFTENPNQENLVTINELGASSIDVGILCYSELCGFTKFKQIKHRLIKEIIKIVEQNNSGFAFPSSSIYLEQMSEK